MRITLLLSGAFGLFIKGPVEFGEKVRERLRQSGVSLPRLWRAPRVSTWASRGELSKALREEAGGIGY